ncbi:MAG: phage portal protein [Gemmatimonadales bacterium]|nr:phage portal protein [Gemmatimonadales bacterium]
MGLWSWLSERIKGAEHGGWSVTQFQAGRPTYQRANSRQLIEKYTGYVYACARINAASCAEVPLKLYATKTSTRQKARFRTKDVHPNRLAYMAKSQTLHKYVSAAVEIEEVIEHPLLDLLRNVNEFMGEFDLMEGLFLYQELVGNHYLQIINDGLGTPVEIWPRMPQYMTIVPDKKKFIKHYEFTVNGAEKYIIDPADIIHFKYLDPTSQFYGMGPLQAAAVAADLNMGMNLHEKNIFENGGVPDFVITYPPEAGKPKPGEQSRIEKLWARKFRRARQRGQPGFLYGGADLKQIAMSPKDMAYLQGRKATLQEIAAIFGVPLSKLTVENVNRANAEAGEYAYAKSTILPRLRKAESKFNENLTPRFDPNLFLAFDNPVPDNVELMLKERETNLRTQYSSINLERRRANEEDVPWGDEPLVSMGIVPLSIAGQSPLVSPADGDGGGQEDKNKATSKRVPPLGHPTNFENEPFRYQLVRTFAEMRADFMAELAEYGEGLVKSIEKASPDDFMSGWFDMQKWEKLLKERTDPFLRYTFMTGAERAMRQMNVETQFNPLNHHVDHALTVTRTGHIQQNLNTRVKDLRKAIAAGMAEGEGPALLKKRVAAVFEGMEQHAAMRIARTETIWAWNRGAMEGYRQSGRVSGTKWVTSGDGRRCQFCAAMDGKESGLGAPYKSAGTEMEGADEGILKFQYEDVLHPPLHPNCLPGDSLVSPRGRILSVSKRLYDGDMLVIRTAAGDELACTPNHPILTDGGWVAANALDVGRAVVCNSASERRSFIHGDHINAPARIEDIAEAFLRDSKVFAVPVPVAAEHFHGDGGGSEVAVIGSKSLLRYGFDAAIKQHLPQLDFAWRDVLRKSLERLCSLAFDSPRDFAALTGGVGGSDLIGTGTAAHIRPLNRLGLASRSGAVADSQQSPANGPARAAKPLSQSINGHSIAVHVEDFINRQRELRLLHRLRSAIGRSLDVTTISHISSFHYRGYVYNLETAQSYYIASNLATHNCRCAIVPILIGE